MAPTQSKALSRLTLDNNKLAGKGFMFIRGMLQSPYCKLAEMSLSRCHLQNEDMFSLARGMDGKYSLQSLNISHNEIRDHGAIILAQAIKGCSFTLKVFDISYNKISVQRAISKRIGCRWQRSLECFQNLQSSSFGKPSWKHVYRRNCCHSS